MAYKMVNQAQTAEERKEKYWLVISCGGTCYDAQRMRDWRLAKIERFFRKELGANKGGT